MRPAAATRTAAANAASRCPQKCLDRFAQHGLPDYCIVCPDKGKVDAAERLAREA